MDLLSERVVPDPPAALALVEPDLDSSRLE